MFVLMVIKSPVCRRSHAFEPGVLNLTRLGLACLPSSSLPREVFLVAFFRSFDRLVACIGSAT